jgi:hypothetical protein
MLGSPGANDPAAGTVTTLVFNDTNGNGLQDAGELGLSGVLVSIYHAGAAGVLGGADDALLATVTTDLGGLATFTGMPAGSFYLQVATPVGLGFTLKDVGANDAIDSDVDGAGRSAVFTLTPGQADTSRDAGVVNAAPTVDIVDVSPDPRNTSISASGGISIVFSEPVTGFALQDVVLRKDGVVQAFDATMSVSSTDGRTWKLAGNGLPGLTNGIGTYELSIVDTGTQIQESVGPGLTLSGSATDTWKRAQAVVADRKIFYNQSKFDGGNAAADVADDGAIAPDKQALLPGQTATFANYTSYSRGINGIMIDVNGLAGTPTVGDFTFKMGNDNAPAGWTVAPNPTIAPPRSINSGAAQRITLIWPNGAISKTWLQVTMKATAVTGLAVDDVFYFGNAIGESGNSATDARVTSTDELLARNNPRPASDPVGITNVYDYNRDGGVSTNDQLISRNSRTTVGTALQLITPPASLQPGGLTAQGLSASAISTRPALAPSGLTSSALSSAALPANAESRAHTPATAIQPAQSLASQLATIRRAAVATVASDDCHGVESDLLESLARNFVRRRTDK